MGIQSPLHAKTFELCKSMKWREWSGYFAVENYQVCHEVEYHAIRHSAGLMDVTPLYKYDIKGKDALKLMDHVIARNVAKMKSSRITYCCWCDDEGKVMDDGTLWCISPEHYRLTAAHPSLRWLRMNSIGMEVEVEDISQTIAVMSLQGPTSRDVLKQVCDADLDKLKFFRLVQTQIQKKIPATITRTGMCLQEW